LKDPEEVKAKDIEHVINEVRKNVIEGGGRRMKE